MPYFEAVFVIGVSRKIEVNVVPRRPDFAENWCVGRSRVLGLRLIFWTGTRITLYLTSPWACFEITPGLLIVGHFLGLDFSHCALVVLTCEGLLTALPN